MIPLIVSALSFGAFGAAMQVHNGLIAMMIAFSLVGCLGALLAGALCSVTENC